MFARPEPIDLLCLPCAGASATMYLAWRRHLPEWLRIVPVELPGRGGRLSEPFIENFDAMVDRLCAEQAPRLTGRYALFGHSMGALLAHGITVRLRERGAALPQALLVSGSPAPAHRDARVLPDKGDDAALIADLRKQGGTPEEVFASGELMRITLDILGSDYRVCQSFVHRKTAPLPMRLHVLAGRDDDIAPERMTVWESEAGGGFSIDWFDGGHFFVRHQQSLVLPVIERRLAAIGHGAADARALRTAVA